MKRLVAVILVLGVLPVAAADDKKEGPDDGWVQLFDGKSLKGWKTHPKSKGDWKVEKGVLVGSGKASHLFSEKEYTNFHYRVKAMINDKGNSGQYFRTQFGPGFPRGYEAQINATGADKVKTGSLYPADRDMRAVKELLVLKAPHKADEWFTQEVICVGDKITIKVNGKTTVEWKDPKHRFKKGHFALQQHDPGSVVKFEKIEVKALPDDKEEK
jgi:hypothetical protein